MEKLAYVFLILNACVVLTPTILYFLALKQIGDRLSNLESHLDDQFEILTIALETQTGNICTHVNQTLRTELHQYHSSCFEPLVRSVLDSLPRNLATYHSELARPAIVAELMRYHNTMLRPELQLLWHQKPAVIDPAPKEDEPVRVKNGRIAADLNEQSGNDVVTALRGLI